MKRAQIIRLYSVAIDLLEVLKSELDSREDSWDTMTEAHKNLCELHDWYLHMEDW